MDKVAFKAGFLSGLADNGLSPSDVETTLEKRAIFGRVLSSGIGAIPALAALGFFGTKALGSTAGVAAQKLTEPTETDVEIAKKEDELREYRNLTEEARLRASKKQLAQM